MKPYPQVTCIGEGFVDFISTRNGFSLAEAPGFVKRSGGAAANVAVGVARLGARAAFAGNVGKDSFGKFFSVELARNGIDVSGIRFDKHHKTRLAFVSLTTSGERDFEFWEAHPADEQLLLKDIHLSKIAKSKIVHIGSFLLLREPSRTSALRTAEKLRRKGCIISFDPNLRLSLWSSRAEARRLNLAMVRKATILRLNEEEALFLAGKKNVNSAVRQLRSLGPSIIVVTMGKEGCYAHSKHGSTFVKGFSVKTVDTTGCGDAFLAALLAGLVNTSSAIGEITLERLYLMCRYANAAAALSATKRGAMAALPGRQQVIRFLSGR